MPTDAPYPPPPWQLQGQGLIVLTLKPTSLANQMLPPHFTSKFMIPGKTPAGYYIAQYTTPLAKDETVWHEWGDVWCFAKAHFEKGYWIREMAVDSNAALLGGMQEWGLNKMMGGIEFVANDTTHTASLTIQRETVRLEWRPLLFSIPFTATLPFLTTLNDRIHQYKVSFRGYGQLCRVHVLERVGNQFTSLQCGNYFGIQFKNTSINIFPLLQSTQNVE